MNIDLSSYIVRNQDSTVNHEATLARFATDLLKYVEERETENAAISAALHDLFDRDKGKRLPSGFVTGVIASRLGATGNNYDAMMTRVVEFIRASPEFDVRKGRGGGIGRVADLPDKE